MEFNRLDVESNQKRKGLNKTASKSITAKVSMISVREPDSTSRSKTTNVKYRMIKIPSNPIFDYGLKNTLHLKPIQVI